MPTAPAHSAKKILLVDDSATGRDLLERMVASFPGGPWELDWADGYAAGLKKLLGGRHVVCLLDYRLGEGKNGLDLLHEARAAGNATPVIFMTADTDPALEDAALDAGAVDYLVKAEFTPRMLGRAVRYAERLGGMLSQLRQQATRDQLTGLHNRREFDRIVSEEWERGTRFDRPFALAMIDVDHFKKINDTYGHQIGDLVLQHVASLLAGQVRLVDRVARYGGEEFGVIMIESDRKGARDAVERLRSLLEETPAYIPEKDLTIPITISAGVAVCPGDADSLSGLIAAADAALYSAKKLGRNRVVPARSKVTAPSTSQAPFRES